MTMLYDSQLWKAAACSAGAILLAGWSLVHGTGRRGLPGCRTDSGCHFVTRGRWSRLGNIPVAAIGLCMYGLLLAAIIHLKRNAGAYPNNIPGSIAPFLGYSCVGAAVWFIFLQGLVIRRWCVYCVFTQVLAVVASCILLSIAPQRHVIIQGAAGLAAVTLLVVGQLVFKPKRYAMFTIAEQNTREKVGITDPPAPSEVSPSESVNEGTRLNTYAPEHRNVVLAAGRMTFDLFDFPLLGPPDATHVMAAFIDFTCVECHHLHRILRQAVDFYAGRLAISMIPIPLHEGCNPTAKCHRDEQAYACNFARLAWRLWITDPAAYQAWDEFLAASVEESQPFGLAVIKARELADIGVFRINEPDRVADGRIAASVVLYQAATMPTVPAVVLEAGIIQGHVPDLSGLLGLVSPHLHASKGSEESCKSSGL